MITPCIGCVHIVYTMQPWKSSPIRHDPKGNLGVIFFALIQVLDNS